MASYDEQFRYTVIDGGVCIDSMRSYFNDSDAKIRIPERIDGHKVTEIDSGAFRDDWFLSVRIPDTVEKIGDNAFRGNIFLETVYMGNGVEYLGDYAFADCDELSNITLSDNITRIRSNTFRNCTSLEEVILPERLDSIEEDAFSGCENLVSVDAPDTLSVKELWEAFSECEELKFTVYSDNGDTKTISASKLYTLLDDKETKWSVSPFVTLYKMDGTSINVKEYEKDKYISKGWGEEEYKTLYNSSGGKKTVKASEAKDLEKQGWTDGSRMTTIYDINGKSAKVPVYQLGDYLKVGWYAVPVVRMYSMDGRTIAVEKSKVSDYKKVGWYDGTETVTIYARDGRTAQIPTYKLNEYKSVGWYDYPVYNSNKGNGYGSTNYKNEYAYVLNNKLKSITDGSFSLVYIDNNNIPELVIKNGWSAEVYTFANGKAIHLGNYTGSNTGDEIYYSPYSGYFYNIDSCMIDGGRGRFFSYYVFSLSGGRVSKAVRLENSFTYGGGSPTYWINGVVVSEAAYESKWNSYNLDKFGYVCNTNEYNLTSSNIARVLR